MKRVLLIDDDATNAEIIRHYLNITGGFTTLWAANAVQAIEVCRQSVDVILLDIMLPDVNGIELCAQLRRHVYCPIIFISCIDDEDIVIRALETGGDDYLVKPFSHKMLLARIQANLRRVEMENHDLQRAVVHGDGFVLDANEHTMRVGERVYRLSSIEYGILTYIMSHPYRTISLDEIYEAVWNAPSHGDVRTVISHVYNLRKKLEQNPQKPRYIRSVRGYGYFFCPNGEDVDMHSAALPNGLQLPEEGF